MDRILVNARCRIYPGRLADFKACAERLIEAVQAREPGTLQYLWYLDEAGSECVVRETYLDSDAVLAHVDNCGPLIAELMATATLALELFGPVSAKLRDTASAFGATFWPYHGGVDRT